MTFNNANWIWWTKTPQPNEYGEFYTTFKATDKPTTLLISADSNYAAYLNGKLVAFGQYADFPYDKVYDEIDLTAHCHAGVNHLAVVVWYYGIDTTQIYYPGNAALLFEVFSGGESVAHSGKDTLARQSRAYQSHGDKKITGQLGFSFHYDATREDGWKTGAVSDLSPATLVEQTLPLRPRPIERLVLEPTVCGKQIKELPEGELLLDLGVNTVGFLDIEVESTEPQTLLISYGEHIVDGCVRRLIGKRDFSVEVTVGKGVYSYQNHFRRLGAKYLQIKGTAPFKLHYLGLSPTTYPLTALPRPALTAKEQAIYDMCERTLRLCMHEHYEDCPWREQALYTNDSRNQMLFGYYAFGEHRFARASLELISKDNRADGLLSVCYPIKKDLVIPSFSLFYPIQCAEYLAHSGDVAFLREIYPKLASVMQVFLDRGAKNGEVIAPFDGDCYWNFYEWSSVFKGSLSKKNVTAESLEPDIALNTLLSISLTHMAQIADALQIPNDYLAVRDRLNEAIRAYFYCPDKQLFCDRRNAVTFSVLGNALAIVAGVTTKEEAAHICRAMLENDTLVPITLSMRHFLYSALLQTDKAHYRDVILSDIERIYTPMLELGVGTVWETEKGDADFHNAGSLCHGWSALPIYYYHLLKK